jgi:CubicO group peptidase (beta-lactamase class C family)
MVPPDRYPIQQAMDELGLAPGANPPSHTPDEWLKRLGSLPLIHQPGAKWLYHTGSDILGVLIARTIGQTLENFLCERICEPLGMKDTGFHVPAEKLARLPPSYMANPATGALTVHDEPGSSDWGRPPAFPSGGGGLVSTVDDYLAFCQMMLNKGRHGRERILSRPSVELMTINHLTPEQTAENRLFFGDSSGWGFGVAVATRRDDLAPHGFPRVARCLPRFLDFGLPGNRRLSRPQLPAKKISSAVSISQSLVRRVSRSNSNEKERLRCDS